MVETTQQLTDFQRKWLRACAVYPVLRWPLTVYLGRRLAKQGEVPDLSDHVPLARLPWFREGRIPEDERAHLIDEMSPEERHQVHGLYRDLLGNLASEIDALKDRPTEDPVFAQFMLDERVSRREDAVNEVLASHYGRNALSRIDARVLAVTIGAFLCTVLLGLGILGLTRGWTIPGAVSGTIPIPQMVQLPGGTFTMGSPTDEVGRDDDEAQREVTLQPFEIARTEVTVRQFRAFVEDTNRVLSGGCFIWDVKAQSIERDPNASWEDPGFPQSGDHPVTCVSWDDAKAYVAWLNTKVPNGGFRLPTEAEWEYAARGNEAGPYYWSGVTSDPSAGLCGYANGADQTMKQTDQFPSEWPYAGCEDGAVYTAAAPAENAVSPQRLPNAFALADMSGNVWEWVEDVYVDNLLEAPVDGSAHLPQPIPDDAHRVVRGGSWLIDPRNLRSADRDRGGPLVRSSNIGFRPARTLFTP